MRLAFLIALCLAMPGAADAGTCQARVPLAYGLANQALEAPLAEGLDRNGNRVEVWANIDTGTWTIVENRPDGQSCIASFGEAFSALPFEDLRTTGEQL
jgi:hypothetical protein